MSLRHLGDVNLAGLRYPKDVAIAPGDPVLICAHIRRSLTQLKVCVLAPAASLEDGRGGVVDVAHVFACAACAQSISENHKRGRWEGFALCRAQGFTAR